MVLGWCVGPNSARNTRDRLRRLERALGLRVLWGAGKQGLRAWTTFSALRSAGLIDDMRITLGELGEQVREFLDRVELVERCLRLLAAEMSKVTRRLDAATSGNLREGVVENVFGVLPPSSTSGETRLPGRPRGSKDRKPRKPRRKRRNVATTAR